MSVQGVLTIGCLIVIEPELEIKRLCFALSEHGLKEFLLSESFQGILLNYDKFDVLWRNIQRRVIDESPVDILISEYTGDAEEIMEHFLNTIYLSKDRRLPSFLDEILLNLSKENDLRPIMNKIRVLLIKMKIKDNRIKQMKALKQLEVRDFLQTAE